MAGHKLTIAYDGAAFNGWQRQAGHPSIQQTVEEVIARIWNRPISIEGSGRTDTGVHAVGQVAGFTAPRKLAAPVLLRALNDHLPFAIRVTKAEFLEPSFHARFDVREKTYEYRVHNAPFSDPFLVDRVWHLPMPLDFAAMEAAAAHLRGEHDFAAMASNAGYARTTTVRTISELAISRRGPLVLFRVTADGFLYHMVRNIVGALTRVGRGKLSPADFGKIVRAGKRTAAPASAPAMGLYLMKVGYYPKPVRLQRAKNRRDPTWLPEPDADDAE
ncbi:tRNA pseudouridine38-40 synthase [Verrucomicrobium sp. GAS474]|nr:tRNA pseudouridine38-40 synthase [Verrucomicrobium sp. GAS474]